MSLSIFIELPTWLGDAVMTTPAIENITQKHPGAKLTLFGSFVTIEALKKHPNVERTIVDESKKSGFRYLNLYKTAKDAGSFDIALSFRKRFSSKFLLFFLQANQKGVYKRSTQKLQHQVLHYNDFINTLLHQNLQPKNLKLYHQAKEYKQPTLGINPGATYGSAKRWYPQKFAQVAAQLSKDYEIVIFGGPSEVSMAKDIEQSLQELGVTNYTNVAGKTTVSQLISFIGRLNLFITNDSGPMHVAAAYQVPTIAIFGPTKYTETSQWMNERAKIVTKSLECSPCMKRSCPLGTHECMKTIEADDVIKAYKELF